MSLAVHGKSFSTADGAPFAFRGLRYVPAPAPGGTPPSARLAADLANIASAGYRVVAVPAALPVVPGAAQGLHLLLELGADALAGLHDSRRMSRRRVRELVGQARAAVRQWRGSDALLGLCLDRPASGRPAAVARVANELSDAIREEDPGLLVAWRETAPVREECPVEADFLIVDLTLARADALAPALLAAHAQVGDRPLVLGSVQLGGGRVDPTLMLDSALAGGAAGVLSTVWRAGAQSARPEPEPVPARTVQDLDVDWPSLTVVINAFNAEATLEECLSHCERLDYPELELLVVDDGSTDATPQIARAHPRVRLVQVPHGGLGAGRNAGWQAARGELVAYLDADAYPTPEWPWYLALAARGERVGACGGPNVPPAHEPRSARAVACAPGGPVPVLEGPARAQHIPGCNMAYWRSGLEAIGGFDPVFDAACDDVELQWRLFDAGLEISYHPAALVWHHRRPGLRPYLRQQRHYGRSQALLERRYPERFPPGYRFRQALGAVSPLPKARARAPVYEVRYLALPRRDGALIGLAHQWGVPVACGLFLTAPAGLWRRRLGAPAVAAAAFICALFFIDVGAAGQGRRRSGRRLDVRLQVATFRVLRPLAFRWGYLRDRAAPDQGRRGRRSGSVGAPPAEHGGDGLKQDRQVEQHRPAL